MKFTDPQVPNTPSSYGDSAMEDLLVSLMPAIELASGLGLYPTYSYFRVYKAGDVLKEHTDRDSCEISVTLNLGFNAEGPWPIWLRANGRDVPVYLNAGDALLYRGIELAHWRTAFFGVHAAQVFLHYVDKNGPCRAWKFDGRPALGMPGKYRVPPSTRAE